MIFFLPYLLLLQLTLTLSLVLVVVVLHLALGLLLLHEPGDEDARGGYHEVGEGEALEHPGNANTSKVDPAWAAKLISSRTRSLLLY